MNRITSTFRENSNYGRESLPRCKGKTLLGIVNKLFVFKVCWQHLAMFCLYTFPVHNLNFHWRWWDGIQAIFLNLFFFISKIELVVISKTQSSFYDFLSTIWPQCHPFGHFLETTALKKCAPRVCISRGRSIDFFFG